MYRIQLKNRNEWDTLDTAPSMKEARSLACNHATMQKVKTGKNPLVRIVGPGLTVFNPTCSDSDS